MNGQPGGTSVPEHAGEEPGSALASAVRALSAAEDVTLLAHVNPDADALGSALALGMALRKRGAVVRVAFGWPEELPVTLRPFDTEGLVVPAAEVPAAPSTLVVCDAGSLQRVGELGDRVVSTIEAGGDVVVVDHHVANTRFGTVHVLDETAEATAVIVLRILDELGVELDLPIARCLYAGLVTDTRSFRIATAATHRIAIRLLETGLDPEAITRPLMDTHPFAWLRMLSNVLGEARLEPEAARGLGFVHATVPLAEADGLGSVELDSVVDVVRTTGEAEVTAVFKELAPDRWSVSLRANSKLDVGKAAVACGGGGHRLASGFTSDGPVEQLLVRLRRALDEAPLLS